MSAHEDLIRACKLDTKHVERLRDTYEKAVQTLGAGFYTWHGFNDIQNMTGLGGQFLWPENPLAPVTMSFTNVSSHPQGVSDGTYTLATLERVTVEQGKFIAIPNNPVIGIAAIELTPQGAAGRGYKVEGMLTDGNWKIFNMQLENLDPKQEFWAVRMS